MSAGREGTREPAAAPKAGRPRDPGIEERVCEAARAVFADDGWAGFGFNQVARRAGVGKNALYLRWNSPQDLLLQALDIAPAWDKIVRSGSVRNQLIDFGVTMLDAYMGPRGMAVLRMFIEANVRPELFEAYWRSVVEPSLDRARNIVLAGIDRGELPVDTDYGDLLDLVHGAVVSRVLVGRHDRRRKNVSRAEAVEYMTRIVDRILCTPTGVTSTH
ncbi:TetR/AcrR family transcriptional regulator [Actinomadura physcomitrii]|uniref:TetR/AcrR family transcriptional regulator n=1 Tax=Actinomadura physcomitrii TaxID=2650748 RepID=UPI001368C6E8|nr:TetR/AcrR family transcriptional regulator [Actinomadura physcomitrii]